MLKVINARISNLVLAIDREHCLVDNSVEFNTSAGKVVYLLLDCAKVNISSLAPIVLPEASSVVSLSRTHTWSYLALAGPSPRIRLKQFVC